MMRFLKAHRNDCLLILVILAVAAAAFAAFYLTMQRGDTVQVSVDGVVTERYDLQKDICTVITTGENGQNTNVLVIKDGKAFVESASCPDKICVGHRPISHVGETVVCLPHKVVISVAENE